MRLRDNNIILNTLRDSERVVDNIQTIPVGYIEVRLSTQGKVGAPEVVHVRNFKVSDIVELAMSSESEIPARLISILNNMIYEDVDVGDWHEKEVEELMLYIFKTFYKNKLEDIPYPLSSEDYKILEQTPKRLEDVKTKKWVPRTCIDISKDVEIYDLPENFTSKIKITNKKTGFYCIFDYIHYKDQLVIKNWLDTYYAEEEAKFKGIKSKIQFNWNIINQLKSDTDNTELVDKLIHYDPEEEKAYNDYLAERLKTLSEVAKIISIINYNGEDISNLTVGEKYELLKDEARLDYGMIAKLNTKQQSMRFGIKPEVSMLNPISGQVVKQVFPFRLSVILQAMQLSGSDDYDDGDDAET
jgi:hypothetical protein